MHLLFAAILGIVEGVTEFLPISSTAHLILTTKLLGLPQNEYWTFFEVFIQAGAILAVITSYIPLLTQKHMLKNVFISFIPTAVIGFLLRKTIKTYFFGNMMIMGSAFVLVAVLFLLLEVLVKKGAISLSKNTKEMTWKEALLIGIIQACAIVPGVSRAGAVLVACMVLGYKRSESALYSFALAVPTIGAAALLDLVKTDKALIISSLPTSIIGFVAAFISALLVVKVLIKYLQGHDLIPFAWYRIIVGVFILSSVFLFK